MLAKGADGAGDRAGGDFSARIDETGAAAVEFRIGLGHFQAEGDRFGMNAVGTADGDRVLVFECTALDGGEKRVHVRKQQVGGLDQLDVEAGVEHIRRGHALVHETGIRADDFGEMGQEGDDIVLGLSLDLVDPVDVESGRSAPFPDCPGGLLGDHAEFRERIAGMGLDLEPDAELGFGRPDSDHFRTGVAGYHGNIRACVALRRV
jgi:hypothetical protein